MQRANRPNLSPWHRVGRRALPETGLIRTGILDDNYLLQRARTAQNGALFRALFDEGNICNYASDSEADQALCNILAFWVGEDRARIDRLFRQSARMRHKWEYREDYRNRTIDAAVRRVQRTWKPIQSRS